MREILDFLSDLNKNNNREWFTANKSRYTEIQKSVNDLTERLIAGISSFDPSVAGNTAKSSTFRIYRDIRFSPDKSPYKTHVGIYIVKGGKKSGYAGYYTHIEPGESDFLPHSLLSSGLYMPEPKVLKSVREDLMLEGDKYLEAVSQAKDFSLMRDGALKRVPTGFPADSPYSEYLKLKDFVLARPIEEELLNSPDPVPAITEYFKQTHKVITLLNRSVDYAYEEM